MKSIVLMSAALVLAGSMAGPASGQDKAKPTALDATAVKSLAADRLWQVKQPRGPGHDYWAWKGDGSVCLRLGEKTGKCSDTGTWRMDGERLCYELTWWGADYKLKSTCFRITERGKGKYAWLEDNGLTFHDFSVVK